MQTGPIRATTRRKIVDLPRSASRRGSAAVEFALVAPLIFLLLFASIEFGRYMMVAHGLNAAAREGCRAALARDATPAAVESTVTERLATFGISGHTLEISPNPPSDAPQWAPIRVRIAVPYHRTSWLPATSFLKGIVLSSSCMLPQEADSHKS